MNYAKGVLKAREAAGLSKRQLALKAGLHPSYLSHIETAKKKPSLDALEAITAVLGISMPILMLLAAEPEELKGIQSEQADQLGVALAALSATLGANG